MTTFRTIDDLDVAGKRVLVRADLNVPMKDGKVTNTTRIDRTVPTLLELADKGAKVIVLSHLGRPKGKKNPEFTLQPVADSLAAIAGRPVAFAGDCIGPEAKEVADAMKNGDRSRSGHAFAVAVVIFWFCRAAVSAKKMP